MSASPKWKVYDADGRYQAAMKEPEAALVIVEFYGDGATVRYDHSVIVWRQGVDSRDSYEEGNEIMASRLPDWGGDKR